MLFLLWGGQELASSLWQIPRAQSTKDKPFQDSFCHLVRHPIAPKKRHKFNWIKQNKTERYYNFKELNLKTWKEYDYLETSPFRTRPPNLVDIFMTNYRTCMSGYSNKKEIDLVTKGFLVDAITTIKSFCKFIFFFFLGIDAFPNKPCMT